jgi:hypothetical protein
MIIRFIGPCPPVRRGGPLPPPAVFMPWPDAVAVSAPFEECQACGAGARLNRWHVLIRVSDVV